MKKNRYPIYVLSRGRHENCLTAKFLLRDGVDFSLVVEDFESDKYAEKYGEENIVVLPKKATGRGAIPVRNWIWKDSIEKGYEYHWILDDNIREVFRLYRDKRIPCNSVIAFRVVEDFTDRYENIGISGLNYKMFVTGKQRIPPFVLNVHVYSFMLIRNDLSYRWRGKLNADTDLTLQVLSGGWCTVLFNAFLADKLQTMLMKGGNTNIYQADGRLKMARSLERMWPHIVTTRRRFQRPQHVIRDGWRKFDTPLKLKPGVDLSKLDPNEYEMKLVKVKEIKSKKIKKIVEEFESGKKKKKKKKASQSKRR